MKIFLVLLAVTAVTAVAQPSNILIYYDVTGGYGDAVVTAAGNLWPACNIQAYTGEPGGQQAEFNTALASLGDGWDIVVVESWYATSNDLQWSALNDLYDTGAIKLFASSWQWQSGTAGQGALATAMGVTGFSAISGSVIPHYAWQTEHAICEGITDWGWADPGLATLNFKFTVDSSADPVTGWASSVTPGEAAICVASDGSSVISGFTPAYANESVPIWENILDFMWDNQALQPETWAGIKASF